MKEKIVLGFLMISLVIFSQKRVEENIELTPYVGLANSFIDGNYVNSRNNLEFKRRSFRSGVHFDYYLNNRWSFRSGISYVQMGENDVTNKLSLRYFTLPVQTNWHFGSARKWNLNFGFTPSVLTNANQDAIKVKQLYKTFQLAFSFGLGYKIPITNKFSILLDFQNMKGITNILKNQNKVRRYNNMYSFNIGLVFML